MPNSQLYSDYFGWMYDKVEAPGQRETYYNLFDYLNNTEFSAIIPMDWNRAEDGRNLRYIFAYENGISSSIISESFEGLPCSVLEMMVALANRCEDSIMTNTNYGDRTWVWFWNMIETLGLNDMYDGNFSPLKVSHAMYRLLNRTYAPNGEGGLFKIHDRGKDMRQIEIWYQMCFYLDEQLGV